MKKVFIFAKRNILELLRDPVIYIFCAGMPLFMLILFQVINSFTQGSNPVFELKSLVPGVMMFSFSFVMLLLSLLVSKDKTTAFLKRLYTSPMKSKDFILGYALPCFLVGIIQEIICIVAGFILASIAGQEYFSFLSSLLLMLEMLPILIINIFLGILFGTLLNDKSAPGITSIFITLSGILGGAWMPLDSMGSFETFCRFLPFYPSVYIGRVITGASHSIMDYTNPVAEIYSFSSSNPFILYLLPIIIFLAISIALCLIAFTKMAKKDKK